MAAAAAAATTTTAAAVAAQRRLMAPRNVAVSAGPPLGTQPEALPLVQRILPFALSTASHTLVGLTLRFTDQRFTLIAIALMLICYIEILVHVLERLRLYVSRFLVSSVEFVIALMVPTYLFQFFMDGFNTSPAPEWFETTAYIVVLVVGILLVVAVAASRMLRSLAATFGDLGVATGGGGIENGDDDDDDDGDDDDMELSEMDRSSRHRPARV